MADENVRIVVTAVDKTRNGLTKVAGSLGSVTRALVSMRTGLAAVVGTAGIGLLVRQSLNAVDALAKTAGRIGTTTEALSRLQHAGSIAGIETNTLNMALQRFVRRTAEAAQGTGEAVTALRELGVDAKEIQKLPLDERMRRLADAFAQVTDQNEKLRLAFKLFDSEGTAVINLLAEGSDGLREMYQEAEMLGLVMRGSAARGVEEANDEFTRLLGLFRGITTQIIAALAPAIKAATEALKEKILKIAEAQGGIEKLGKFFAVEFLNFLKASLAGVQRFVNNFITGINGLIETIDEVRQASNDWLGTSFEKLNQLNLINLDPIISEVENLTKAIVNSVNEADEGIDEIAVKAKAPWYMPMINGLRNFAKAITDVNNKIELTVELQKFASNTMDSFTRGFTDAITGAKNFKDAIKDMARSVINDLIRMLTQYYITQALFGAITSGINSLFPTAAPASTGSTSMATAAVGAPTTAGRPMLVGENGPELFVPASAGRIEPNGRMNAGGVTINQSLNFSTGVAQTVRAEVLNLMPQIQEATKAAVANSRQRGGSFSKAMVGA